MSTALGIVVITVLIVGWDVYLYVSPQMTISQVMASLPDRRPRLFAVIFAAWSGLAIHWWWPTCV